MRIASTAALALLVGLLCAPLSHAGKLFLWEVESKSTRVYLLGSIHLARPEIFPLDPVIEQAYERSARLVVEADLEEMNDPAVQARVLEAGTYGEGASLSGSVSAETLQQLQEYLGERSLPLAVFDGMRPWMVAVSLSVLEMQRNGLSPESGIDKHFLDRAKSTQKPIEQLESAAAQIELFAAIPEPLQERFLVQSMDEAERIPEILDSLMTAWAGGDTATLAGLLLESMNQKEMKPVYKMLYTDRNKAMTAKIRGYLEQSEISFVVVGAAHLVGEGGIVDLLAGSADLSVRQLESR